MESQFKRIGMLLFDGCDLLDFAGPTAVFHSAARHLVRTGHAEALLYKVELLSIEGGLVDTLAGCAASTLALRRPG